MLDVPPSPTPSPSLSLPMFVSIYISTLSHFLSNSSVLTDSWWKQGTSDHPYRWWPRLQGSPWRPRTPGTLSVLLVLLLADLLSECRSVFTEEEQLCVHKMNQISYSVYLMYPDVLLRLLPHPQGPVGYPGHPGPKGRRGHRVSVQ